MNNRVVLPLISICILFSGICLANEKAEDFPTLKGPYLGQKPPGMAPEIFAPGIITLSTRNELNSVFSPKGDEFYFAVCTPKPIDTCVIMVSRRINGVWTRPKPTSFSGNGIDVDMAFSPDGNRLYFCSVRGSTKHDIWYSDRQKDNSWSRPIKLGPSINSAEVDVHPTFTRSGRMYFSAVRPEGLGGKDIYYADSVGGKFSKPSNPGHPLNSSHSEGDVFVAPDESFLIVSIQGSPDSLGQGDLYISFKKKDGTWTAPKNLGRSVNTSATEYSPMISPDGKYLFFSRYEDGKSDIFWIDAKVAFRQSTEANRKLPRQ